MIAVFHSPDEQTHEAFQSWRRVHVDGFHMTEGPSGTFTVHWAQDARENQAGRGCHHQGMSTITYGEDKHGCYTTARKVCSENLDELLVWAAERKYQIKKCYHCDTEKFPFPRAASI